MSLALALTPPEFTGSAAPQAACRLLKVELTIGVLPAFALLVLIPVCVLVSNDCIQQAWVEER